MNMHVNFGAVDYEAQHRAANIVGCEKLLLLLMWKHPERMTFNPRLLPVPRLNISPFVEGYLQAKLNAKTRVKKQESRRRETERQVPTIAQIKREVAHYYGILQIDLSSARRTANVTKPRQMAIYLSRTLTLNSLPQIGRQFGDRDHTTCLHAVRKVDSRILSDEKTAKDVAVLSKILAPEIEVFA